MVVLDEAILVLHNLTTQDSGFYKCSAENDHGVTEATAKITVMGKLTEVITTCGRSMQILFTPTHGRTVRNFTD